MKPKPLKIRERPSQSSIMALLEAKELPNSDLTEAHLEYSSSPAQMAPTNVLVGLEIYGENALLRPLVMNAVAQTQDLSSAARYANASIGRTGRSRSNPHVSSRVHARRTPPS